VLDWLRSSAPDVALLQEIKCVEEAFPRLEIEELGYNVLISGQKSYNGVAILSKLPIEEITREMLKYGEEDHARYLEAYVFAGHKTIRVASVYVPNGQEVGSDKFRYKLDYFKALIDRKNYIVSTRDMAVIGGDYNVAPEAIDVYNPKGMDGSVGFHPEERRLFAALKHTGFYDAFRIKYPTTQQFSWWDYRAGSWQQNKGMRIDHLMLSASAIDNLKDCGVDAETRAAEKASDHAPVWCTINMENP